MMPKLICALMALWIPSLLAAQAGRAADEVHEGKVIAVGSDTITVLDQRDDDNDKFTVTSATKITYNGKPAKLNEIHAGDRAKVVATQEGDKLIAKEISARSPE
jgi:uncharacterized protein DUF5666